MRNPSEPVAVPAIYLQPALLVVRQGDPLVAPVTRAHRIAVSPTRRRRAHAQLPRDRPLGRQREDGHVARRRRTVGARRRE